MIYTNNIASNSKSKGLRILITRSAMSWVTDSMYDYWIKELAPISQLRDKYKSGKISKEEYTTKYLENLNKEVLSQIIELGNLRDVTLLCYCGKGKFCHRNIIREELRKLCVPCEEL